MALPKYYDLFNPVLHALRALGGSASIAELEDKVTQALRLSEDDISQPHAGGGTELHYRLAWARTYLKKYGLLDNSERGIWLLTAQGRVTDRVNSQQVVQSVRESFRRRRADPVADPGGQIETLESRAAEEVGEEAESWREELMANLLRLPPSAFERLCQRLLRESGFVEVKVTGRSGDGGIDGVGIVRLGGLLGFPILFQCKRYQGSVGPRTIRDFRGAMMGRADRGLVLTTGTFSRDAKLESTRDGAPPIDLVDGEQLLDKLKELGLGVTVTHVEHVSVEPAFFESI